MEPEKVKKIDTVLKICQYACFIVAAVIAIYVAVRHGIALP